MTSLVGQSVGHYHIIEQIGTGGMAIVYKAYDIWLEREVAIKIIRRGAFPPDHLERILKRFEREAKVLAKLSHPNIVKILEYGEHDGMPYLVMEYLPGGTLKQQSGLATMWQQAVELLIPVAQALDYAHHHHVIHRDIKPSNILLTENGHPMLTDFGIAKMLEMEETAALTGTGVGLGTPEYMAPEQGRGQTDARSDIYSLGVVLYEMVAGRKPFIADTPLAVVLMHTADPLPSPRQSNPKLPVEMEKIIIKALAKKPENRYQTMDEFARILSNQVRKAGKEIKTSIAPKSPVNQEQTTNDGKFLNRSFSWIWALGAFTTLAVLIFLLTNKLGLGSSSKPESNLTAQLSIPTTGMSFTPAPIASVIPTSINSPTGLLPTSVPSTFPSPANLAIGSSMASPVDGMAMMYVPDGEFLMGAADANLTTNDDERPEHSVFLDAFWIDKTEVTNAMYAICVQAGSCQLPHSNSSETRKSYFDNKEYANYPVVFVGWDSALSYCAWAGRRLPTEAEWEKAARGVNGQMYPWGNNEPTCNLTNINTPTGVCIGDTTQVGNYPSGASPYGVLDMIGNVDEWVADWYGSNYYLSSSLNNPIGPTTGTSRVLRGGSWSYPTDASAINRYRSGPTWLRNIMGFRCAMGAEN